MNFVLALVLGLGSVLPASDEPTALLSAAYKPQFENEWVRVVHVTYAPHVKLPVHAHPRMAAAYVYLNDAGPVVFRHAGREYGEITRPPTKAGAFRLHRAVTEEHAVENLSDTASEFLRVEFKTDPQEQLTLRGRFYSEPNTAGRIEHLQFENAQLRITRLVLEPSQSTSIVTTDTVPALVIALTDGHEQWVPAHSTQEVSNPSDKTIELLRFDFKTAPVRYPTN